LEDVDVVVGIILNGNKFVKTSTSQATARDKMRIVFLLQIMKKSQFAIRLKRFSGKIKLKI